ncbi:MAG: hypothetical protein LBH03_05350 [Holophagales bacterium]|jgi:hypothetical protein|nr:hypothetical protein [Holophagales bacterium]
MQVKPTLVALAVAVAIGTSIPAVGQELSYGIKFGGGLALSGIEAQSSRATLGFALTGEWNFRQKDELFAEVGYKYFKADWVDRTRLPNKPAGYDGYNFLTGVGYTPSGQGHIFNSNPWQAAAQGSVDMRKEDIEGWGASFGYRYNLPNTNLYFHGALMLNVIDYFEETLGELRVYNALPIDSARVPALIHQEGLAYTNGKHSFSPGFYVGGQWRMDRNFFIELNLNWISYSTIQYQPLVYTGQAAHTTEDKDSKVFLDFSFGLRF